MARLNEKVAIITGAARGMGAATARLFVEEGARVVLTDVLVEEGEAVTAELGDAARFIMQDVSDDAGWGAVVETAKSAFGGVDVLVNNAGVVRIGTIDHQTRADWDEVLGINLIGPFLGVKRTAPEMIARGGGSIINISSTDGLKGSNGLGAYAASKWGLRGFSKVAAHELGPKGVRVNTVHPGPVNNKIANPMDAPLEVLNPMFQYYPLQRPGYPM